MPSYLTLRPFHAIQWHKRSSFSRSTATVEVSKAIQAARKSLQTMRATATYSGEMTEHSQMRMKNAVENLHAIAQEKRIYRPDKKQPLTFTINFITLTLPSEQHPHTDRQVHETIFITWLEYAKRRKGLTSYVWKCERQKNGNLHYHLLTDCYFDKDWLTRSWNHHCERLKLVTKFLSKYPGKTPPSTQVKAARNSEDVQRYIRKYLGKKVGSNTKQLGLHDDATRLQGVKCWDASIHLKVKEKCTTEIDQEMKSSLEFMEWLTPKSVYKSEYFTYYKLNQVTAEFILTEKVLNNYLTWKGNIIAKIKTPHHTTQATPQYTLSQVSASNPAIPC